MNTSTSLPILAESIAQPRERISSSTSSATTTPRPSPRPPTLSHSTSTPQLPTSTSTPNLSTPGPPQTPNKTPKSTSKNYHPYLIHSTSSSLLTRSNSSPAQPIHTLTHHRGSHSLSSIPQFEGIGGYSTDEDRKSVDGVSSPNPGYSGRRIVRSGKSGMLPGFLDDKDGGGGSPKPQQKVIDLPNNPRLWTPSELAVYLTQALRTGGEDGLGQRLPGPLVEDIKSWVLRHRITGRAFVCGNSDTWANSSRPPPFLTLLQSISRRLRRASIQGTSKDPLDDTSSVLLETDEEDDDEISGVRRMANALESRGNGSIDASSSSDVEDKQRLRAQLTGGSEGWERWGLKKQHTGSKGEKEKDVKDMLSSSPEDDILVTPLLDQEPMKGIGSDEEGEEGGAGTIKAPPLVLEGDTLLPPQSLTQKDFESDIPAYPSRLTVERSLSANGTPKAGSVRESREVTPTPERPEPSQGSMSSSPIPTPIAEEIATSTQKPQGSPASSRYSSLRSKGRNPSLRGKSIEDGYTTSDERTTMDTMRRTTLKPASSALDKLFQQEKTKRELELEEKLKEVMDRVKVLENELKEASRPVTPTSSALRTGSNAKNAGVLDLVLGRLGVVGQTGEDGLPTRVGELPGYLFLVGFGVGAVMMRVLFGRARV